VKILGPLIVCFVLLAPAIRLLGLGLRTRRGPEVWAGLYFLGAAIGIPLRVYGSSILQADPELATLINTFGHLFFAGGTIAMTIFTWRVFHAASRGALLFSLATITAIVATTAYTLGAGLASEENSSAMIVTNFARLIPTYWACFESFRYWRAMRKRIRLGLADPIVANRFALWAIWTFAVSVLPSITLSLRIAAVFLLPTLENNLEVAHRFLNEVLFVLRIVFLVIAPIAAIALSLSFFPPVRYLDRIRARTASTA
jgi:hypothetical protein